MADLVDACGEDPGFLCEQVFEATDNETLAEIVDWFAGRPLTLILILVGAWLVNRIVRRGIDRATDRLVKESRTAEENAQQLRIRGGS